MEQQHLLLCERLQVLLALHGRHLRVSSSTRMSTGIVPPTYGPSVLLSGREGPAIDASAVRSPVPHRHRRARTLHLARSAGAALERPAPAGGQEPDGRGNEEDVGAAGIEAQHGELAPAPWLYAGDRGRATVTDPRLQLVALEARSTAALPTFLRLDSERYAAKCGLNRSLARTPATGFTSTRCASAAFASHFPYHIHKTRRETLSHPTVSPALIFLRRFPPNSSFFWRYLASSRFPIRHCDCIFTDLADRADPSYIVDFALARATARISMLSRPSYTYIVSYLSWTYVRTDFTDLDGSHYSYPVFIQRALTVSSPALYIVYCSTTIVCTRRIFAIAL
ncbi:hypothetical protein B0H14DRAFT_3904948 [Mycena olivaceomarginata]|nr:hypothetical protein B0H14DRAFT_3904948 [Mycena olivaceomarginata]